MDILGRNKLIKLKKKNIGNVLLTKAIDKLITDLQDAEWVNISEMLASRLDADCVYEGFYFFDIHIHRTLIAVEFDKIGEATIVWCGSHDEYEIIFKNNKDTIRKWLKNNEWIN